MTMNYESKSIFTSVTFWGLVLAVAAPLLGRYGITLPADTTGIVNDVATGAGAVISVWGRMHATVPAHIIPPRDTGADGMG